MEQKLLRKFLLLVVAFTVLASCVSTSKSATAEYTGVWKLQEAYLNTDYSTYHYLVINSDDTAEIWQEFGLEALGVLRMEDGILHWFNTQYPPDSSKEGLHVIADYTREGDVLRCVYYPEDRSWEFEQVYTRVDKLPEFTYKNNFEDNSLKYIVPQLQVGGEAEWQIIDEPGNPGNKIIAPVYADENSDAEILVSTGKNFSLEFDMKQTKNSDTDEICWMALDFLPYTNPGDNYNPFWLYSDFPGSFSSGDREEDYSEITYVSEMNWDTWHTLKVTVREGKYFRFYLDGHLFGEREVEETLFTGFKIEGNHETGRWFMDNLNIRWNEVD